MGCGTRGAGQETAVPERLTEGKRKGESRKTGRERWVRNERAGKTTGEHDSVGRYVRGGHGLAGSGSGAAELVDVRVAEEAEADRKEEGRVPPCGDGSGGKVVCDARRAWALRSAVEGSGGGEDSTGRGGKMEPGAGGSPEKR